MPVQKYLELDSTYRNRNVDANPASFTVTMSQYGIKSQQNAIDPVSNAYPIISFSPANYTNTMAYSGFAANTFFGEFTLLLPPSNPNTLYLLYLPNNNEGGLGNRPPLPKTNNFFVGLDIIHVEGANLPFRRISEWECVYDDPTKQIFKAVIDGPFSTFVPNVAATLVIQIYQDNPLYFLPASLGIPDFYNKFYIQNQTQTFSTDPPVPTYGKIIDFDRDSHYASIGDTRILSGMQTWSKFDTYAVRMEIPIVSAVLTDNSINNSSVKVGNAFFQTTLPNTAINAYINFFALNIYTNVIRKIVAVAGTTIGGEQIIVSSANGPTIDVVLSNGSIEVVNLDTLILSTPLPATPAIGDQYEILQYSNDNYSPFVYSGTMSSNSQPVSYDMTLNSLTLPNRLLANGGRIAYYPYVYVIIENVSTTGGNPKNMIYSNNPNTYRAVFRAPITDLNHPANSPFVKLTGNGMKQTMVFKQNDDMSMTILLPNGEIFKTEENDTFNGEAPNPVLQISAVFSMERIQ